MNFLAAYLCRMESRQATHATTIMMGRNDFNHSFVSTSNLSVQEIDDFWHKLNNELEELGIPK